jgi:hypothetical protein
MTRQERERELNALLANPVGRGQLLKLLREQMQIPAGQILPVGTPIIQTILNHEFAGNTQIAK